MLLCQWRPVKVITEIALEIYLSSSPMIIYSTYSKSLSFILQTSSPPVSSTLCDAMLRLLNGVIEPNFGASLLRALPTAQPPVRALKFQGTQESTGLN